MITRHTLGHLLDTLGELAGAGGNLPSAAPVPVSVTAASDVTGISPLNSPVRSTPRRSMAPYHAMNTRAVIAIVK